jgi:hypothetical protein
VGLRLEEGHLVGSQDHDRGLESLAAEPLGPALKLALAGCQGGTGQGPLEETSGHVNFLGVIF